MTIVRRYLFDKVAEDLQRKMVFVGGPRQVGKTTFAEAMISSLGGHGILLNWDDDEDREKILKKEFPVSSGTIVFDEIHKNHRWRNYLKGLFDKKRADLQILVTGSARLDLYRFGGDSLQGRYYYHRLHPLSVAELGIVTQDGLESLLRLSGFPEPFFSQSETEKKRWSIAYRSRIMRDDIRDLERVVEISSIELLATRLPRLVGSTLSLNSLREDLQVAHASVENWVNILERVYYIFRIQPFGPPKVRAIKKAQKHYHYDWTLVEEPGARFENFVASHLLKWVQYQEDAFGRELELRFYRDAENREVDFILVENGEPIMFIEAKLSSTEVTSGLKYLKGRYPSVRAVQVSLESKDPVLTGDGIEKIAALKFLQELV